MKMFKNVFVPSSFVIFPFVFVSLLFNMGCNEGQATAKLPKEKKKVSPISSETGNFEDISSGSNTKMYSEEDLKENSNRIYTGTTEAHQRSTIGPTAGGVVKKVWVREGDFVKAKSPIVTLDKSDINLQRRQAQAALDAAKANYELSKMDWERSQALLQSGGISQSQFDMIDAKFKAAKAGMEQATVALDMARKALGDATIKAPYDGIVVKRLVSEGERVTMMPPTPIAIIEEIDTLDLRIQVPETDMKLFKVGDEVNAYFSALGKEVKVKIVKIVESVDPRTRSFSVIGEIDNKNHELRSGMFAEIKLSTDIKEEEKK